MSLWQLRARRNRPAPDPRARARRFSAALEGSGYQRCGRRSRGRRCLGASRSARLRCSVRTPCMRKTRPGPGLRTATGITISIGRPLAPRRARQPSVPLRRRRSPFLRRSPRSTRCSSRRRRRPIPTICSGRPSSSEAPASSTVRPTRRRSMRSAFSSSTMRPPPATRSSTIRRARRRLPVPARPRTQPSRTHLAVWCRSPTTALPAAR